MAAYLVVEHIITDAAKFEEHRTKVGPMIARHGGRYLTKSGSHKMQEGGHWKPERVLIIEFPDIKPSTLGTTRLNTNRSSPFVKNVQVIWIC
jgi:uncharacterized protein (DUF1330 family)